MLRGAPVRPLLPQRRGTPGVRREAQHPLARAQYGHIVQAGLPAKVALMTTVNWAHGSAALVMPATPNLCQPGLRSTILRPCTRRDSDRGCRPASAYSATRFERPVPPLVIAALGPEWRGAQR